MTHQSVEDSAAAVPPDLVRLSVGIEDAGDLIADLRQAIRPRPCSRRAPLTIASCSAYAGDSILSGGTNSSCIPFIITAKANVRPLSLRQ